VFIDVVSIARQFTFAGKPSAGVNEKLSFEGQKMWVTRVPEGHGKLVDFPPSSGVVAIQYDDP
jgi:hypothetical protein